MLELRVALLIVLVSAVVARVVRVHLGECGVVDHDAADRFVHDCRAPSLVLHVVGLRDIVRSDALFGEFHAPLMQLLLIWRSLV